MDSKHGVEVEELQVKGYVKDIYKIFDSSQLELVIPVYQRNYDWGIPQCERLLQDLTNLVTTDRRKHFFGAIVCNPEGSFRLVVIDGQQRLTTVSILMLALSRLLDTNGIKRTKDSGGNLGTKIRDSYLLADGDSTTPKFKLKQVKDNAEAYRRLFGPESEFMKTSSITANYLYFLDALPKTALTGDQIWDAICRLEVMHLDLEHDDDPQRIFESLNSTGLALTDADKVRNLVLMGLDSKEQEQVYEDYWNRIEKNVDFQTDKFLRSYLTSKAGKAPKKTEVYEAFKRYAEKTGTKGAELLDEVRTYSDYYRLITKSQTEISVIDRTLRRLNLLQSDVIQPLLMPLFGDVKRGAITHQDYANTLELIESFLFRRFACHLPSNYLTNRFASLYREVDKWRDKALSATSIIAYYLTGGPDGKQFPTDEEFKDGFSSREMYKIGRNQSQYMWECLENGRSKDNPDIAGALDRGDFSIEHIMPQTLNDQWRTGLGENYEQIHAKWLGRIGNLTITGYNSSYQNASFLAKKEAENGFKSSPYRVNELLKKADKWDEEQMRNRSQELSDTALSYWKYPSEIFEPPVDERPSATLGFDTDFTGRSLVEFSFADKDISVDSWRKMFELVLRELATTNRAALFDFASNDNTFAIKEDSTELGSRWSEISPGLFAWINTSTQHKVRVLRNVFDHLSIDPEDLVFRFARGASDEPEIEDDEATKVDRYASLTSFIGAINELTMRDADPEAFAALANELRTALSEYPGEDYLEVLGGPAATFASEENRLAEASEEQLIALLKAKVDEDQLFNPGVLEETLQNGSARTWLELLHKRGIQNPQEPIDG